MTESDKKPIGRPSLYGERMVTRQISLAANAWETLKERYGGDNYSVTVRNALLRLVELENRQAAES
jgi:hypothetical protein